MFDADEETVEAPELRLGGVVYKGRVISIAEWFTFRDRFAEQGEREKAAPEDASVFAQGPLIMLDFLRATFPAASGVDPIAEIERRGDLAIRKTFSVFFGHTLLALGLVRPQGNPPTTDG